LANDKIGGGLSAFHRHILAAAAALRAKKFNHEMAPERYLRLAPAKPGAETSLQRAAVRKDRKKARKYATKAPHRQRQNTSNINSLFAGWGGRTRTSEWRNQNPTDSPYYSMHILKNPNYSPLVRSIA
jgi:hypothetical protein